MQSDVIKSLQTDYILHNHNLCNNWLVTCKLIYQDKMKTLWCMMSFSKQSEQFCESYREADVSFSIVTNSSL